MRVKKKSEWEKWQGTVILCSLIIVIIVALFLVPHSNETQQVSGANLTTTTSASSPQQTAQPKNQKEITISHSSFTRPYLLVIGNSPGTSGTMAASAGKEFLVVEATITNNGYDEFAVNPYSFTVVINSVKYDIDAVHTFMVGNKLDSVELLNGGSTTGSIVFEIPSGIATQDYQLKYDETCLFNCHEFVYKV